MVQWYNGKMLDGKILKWLNKYMVQIYKSTEQI